jgi:hypothetical protein
MLTPIFHKMQIAGKMTERVFKSAQIDCKYPLHVAYLMCYQQFSDIMKLMSGQNVKNYYTFMLLLIDTQAAFININN